MAATKNEYDHLLVEAAQSVLLELARLLHDYEDGKHDGYYVNLTFPAGVWSLHRLNDMTVELIILGKSISPTIDYDGCEFTMPKEKLNKHISPLQ